MAARGSSREHGQGNFESAVWRADDVLGPTRGEEVTLSTPKRLQGAGAAAVIRAMLCQAQSRLLAPDAHKSPGLGSSVAPRRAGIEYQSRL